MGEINKTDNNEQFQDIDADEDFLFKQNQKKNTKINMNLFTKVPDEDEI